MRVKSFIDVMSTTPRFEAYTVVSVNTHKDMFSGEPTDHECILYSPTYKESQVSITSVDVVKDFRTGISQSLNGIENIIIIDYISRKIFTDIIKDKFFNALAYNIEEDIDTGPWKVERLEKNNSLQTIIERAFPDPVLIKNKKDSSSGDDPDPCIIS
jgi:hypothetical protein